MNKNDDKGRLTGHEYDGIQEYDNPLPRWWLLTFYGTIIFAIIYWVYHELVGAPTQLALLKEDMSEISAMKDSKHNPNHNENLDIDKEFEKLKVNNDVLTKGKEVFQSKCMACHGPELQGVIGPNLVDEYWIHGKGRPSEILVIVQKGVLDKGMPGWESLLKEDEMMAVVSYIESRKGTKPDNPKAPQGDRVVSE